MTPTNPEWTSLEVKRTKLVENSQAWRAHLKGSLNLASL